MLRLLRGLCTVVLFVGLILVGACVYHARDSRHWIETEHLEDGSYSRIKIVDGVFEQEIGYGPGGVKQFHRYTDFNNAVHLLQFDESGDVVSHDVTR